MIKQVMTNHTGDRDIISRDSVGVWKNGLSPLALPRATNNFPDPPESLESNSITCHPSAKVNCRPWVTVQFSQGTSVFKIGLV